MRGEGRGSGGLDRRRPSSIPRAVRGRAAGDVAGRESPRETRGHLAAGVAERFLPCCGELRDCTGEVLDCGTRAPRGEIQLLNGLCRDAALLGQVADARAAYSTDLCIAAVSPAAPMAPPTFDLRSSPKRAATRRALAMVDSKWRPSPPILTLSSRPMRQRCAPSSLRMSRVSQRGSRATPRRVLMPLGKRSTRRGEMLEARCAWRTCGWDVARPKSLVLLFWGLCFTTRGLLQRIGTCARDQTVEE
jgi:hypothetical protein